MEMRMTRGLTLAIAALFFTTACYHATIDTGLTPSNVTVEKHWANGWIYGLVPPATIETAQKCPSGVARVETQLSFLNQLVSFLTIGIYTPMNVKIQCAQRGTALLPVLNGGIDKVAALESAIQLSQMARAPVFVAY
jgi:Bor protein